MEKDKSYIWRIKESQENLWNKVNVMIFHIAIHFLCCFRNRCQKLTEKTKVGNQTNVKWYLSGEQSPAFLCSKNWFCMRLSSGRVRWMCPHILWMQILLKLLLMSNFLGIFNSTFWFSHKVIVYPSPTTWLTEPGTTNWCYKGKLMTMY